MERATTIVTGAAALVMAVATAFLGFTIPGIWALESDMGGVKVRLEEYSKRFENFDKKLDGMDTKLDTISKRVDGIDGRLAARDTDPASLVAQSGLRPESEFGGVRVGEKLYVLPKTDKAQAELATSGLQREPITPSTFGYVIGKYDDFGRLTVTTGTAAGGDSPGGTGPGPTTRGTPGSIIQR